MGREIRRVPENWLHPKKENGNYQPLNDQSFNSAFKEWQDGLQKWIAGEDPDADAYKYPKTARGYIDWNGGSPDPEYYREEEWTTGQASCYQIYETVSEGTPKSPVFVSLDKMQEWLTTQGYLQKAAESFARTGYAPSMIMSAGVIKAEIHACEEFNPQQSNPTQPNDKDHPF